MRIAGRFGLSGAALKCLACCAMLCDHLFKTFEATLPYPDACRIVGRLAFPIFAFLIAEGAAHTRSFPRYLLRLAAFALLSELPFDLALYGKAWHFGHQNVFFTFLLALPVLWLLRLGIERDRRFALAVPPALGLACLAAEALHTDYNVSGVLCVFVFGLVRLLPERWRFLGGIGVALTALLNTNRMQPWAMLAILPILLYNGQRGRGGRWLQYGCYLFYPVHLAGLFLMRHLFY